MVIQSFPTWFIEASMAGLIVLCVLQSVRSLVYTRRVAKKLDTVWGFMYRRGLTEAIAKKLVDDQAFINGRARDAYADIVHKLKEIVASMHDMPDAQIALEIEDLFGETLARQICPILGIAEGACLVLAVKLGKEKAQ